MNKAFSLTKQDIERFWSKVDKRSENECWLWQAGCSKFGHGRFGVAGEAIFANRISYVIAYGAIPDDLCVLHRCDVPACVNPKHLFLGTRAENVYDMHSKHRHVPPVGKRNGTHTHPESRVKGELHGMSKLNPTIVKEMRHLRSKGITYQEIAARANVSESTAIAAIKGETWSHVKD